MRERVAHNGCCGFVNAHPSAIPTASTHSICELVIYVMICVDPSPQSVSMTPAASPWAGMDDAELTYIIILCGGVAAGGRQVARLSRVGGVFGVVAAAMVTIMVYHKIHGHPGSSSTQTN